MIEGREAMVLADAIEAEAWRDMFAGMPAQMAEALRTRVLDVAGATVVLAPGVPVPFFNRAIGLGAERPVTEADLDAVLATFAAAGASTFLVHTSAATRATGELDAWLAARGLVPYAPRPRWAKCLRGTEPVPEVTSTLSVRPADPARADELASVLAEAHGMPPAMAPWIAALVRRPSWHAHALFDDDKVVGGGFVFVRGDRAWLGLAGTAPSHRRRHGQRAVMAARVRDAIARGVVHLATETGEPLGDEPNPSLANMRACGFRQVGSRWNWTRKA